jgi:hypothetical protein
MEYKKRGIDILQKYEREIVQFSEDDQTIDEEEAE